MESSKSSRRAGEGMTLEEIEKLCSEATAGPWEADGDHVLSSQYCIADTNEADAKFIAASREIVPQLCKRVRELEAENEALKEIVKGLKQAVDLYRKDNKAH